jgi:futalosine hydrolase
MNILLVTATLAEIKPFVNRQNLKLADNGLYTGRCGHHTVCCIITGVGMVATTYHLTTALQKSSYDLVVNAGIAGNYRADFYNGLVVEVVSEQFADFGIDNRGAFVSAFAARLVQPNEHPFCNEKLVNAQVHEFTECLPKAHGITVNKSSGNQPAIDALCQLFSPDVESMEGAAVFYVCLNQNIPFAEIRAISNLVEPRNRDNWNISLAIEQLNSTLIDIFADL